MCHYAFGVRHGNFLTTRGALREDKSLTPSGDPWLGFVTAELRSTPCGYKTADFPQSSKLAVKIINKMTTKVVYFVVDGRNEQTEFHSDDDTDDFKR